MRIWSLLRFILTSPRNGSSARMTRRTEGLKHLERKLRSTRFNKTSCSHTVAPPFPRRAGDLRSGLLFAGVS